MDWIGPAIVAAGSLLNGYFSNQNQQDINAQNQAFSDHKFDQSSGLALQLQGMQDQTQLAAAAIVPPATILQHAYQNYINNKLAASDRQSQAFQMLAKYSTAPL